VSIIDRYRYIDKRCIHRSIWYIMPAPITIRVRCLGPRYGLAFLFLFIYLYLPIISTKSTRTSTTTSYIYQVNPNFYYYFYYCYNCCYDNYCCYGREVYLTDLSRVFAFTRYCHDQYCMVYGIYTGGRGRVVYCAIDVQ